MAFKKRWVGFALLGLVMIAVGSQTERITAYATHGESRVDAARDRVEDDLRSLARERGLRYPVRRLFLRAFKQERLLEVWGADRPGKLTLLRTYSVAGQSGGPGPKRKEGDKQVPEGVYRVDRFNPRSLFHLSLGLNYPNASDKIRGDQDAPGSDIFIHGDTRSVGCLAMTDAKMEEIYILALGAREAGIPVHVFPTRMEGARYRRLQRDFPQHREFWAELEPIYRAFEQTRQVPKVRITEAGAYQLVND